MEINEGSELGEGDYILLQESQQDHGTAVSMVVIHLNWNHLNYTVPPSILLP